MSTRSDHWIRLPSEDPSNFCGKCGVWLLYPEEWGFCVHCEGEEELESEKNYEHPF